MRIDHSPVESARFGRRVGRSTLNDSAELDSLCSLLIDDAHDLVIVRYPSSLVRAFDLLTGVPGRRVIYADTLLYFRWNDDDRDLSVVRPCVGREAIGSALLSQIVTATFTGYKNHYAANPSLDASTVALGYAEWAASLAMNSENVLVANLAERDVAGLAVIDASGEEWDVALAGVVPDFRGQGVYGDLITSVMAEARRAGQRSVLISTQSHNLQVMRTWERLGWRIAAATVTVHLERGTSFSSS